MPDRANLAGTRIAMLFEEKDVDNDEMDEVRKWYFGKVVEINLHDGTFKARIEWDVGGDATSEELDADKWAGPRAELLVGSWMVV